MKNMFLDQTLTSPWTVWQSKRNFSPISFFFFRSLRVCKNFYEKIDVEGGNWLPPALSHKKYESSGYDTVIFNGISSIFSLHSMDLCADRCRYTIRSSKSTGFCARVFIQVKTFFFSRIHLTPIFFTFFPKRRFTPNTRYFWRLRKSRLTNFLRGRWKKIGEIVFSNILCRNTDDVMELGEGLT